MLDQSDFPSHVCQLFAIIALLQFHWSRSHCRCYSIALATHTRWLMSCMLHFGSGRIFESQFKTMPPGASISSRTLYRLAGVLCGNRFMLRIACLCCEIRNTGCSPESGIGSFLNFFLSESPQKECSDINGATFSAYIMALCGTSASIQLEPAICIFILP